MDRNSNGKAKQNEEFRKSFFQEAKQHNNSTQRNSMDVFYQHQQRRDDRDYATSAHLRAHAQQRQEYENRGPKQDQSSYYDGGDATQQMMHHQNLQQKDLQQKPSQMRRERMQMQDPNATYSEISSQSDHSDCSRTTTIAKGTKGKHLLRLTHSKASLMKTVNDGLSALERTHNDRVMPPVQARQAQKQACYVRSSEESHPCSSAPAGLINEKIIHPMIKKFRLLYLHNIKEEVTIMEDLELLPHQLDEICRKTERE